MSSRLFLIALLCGCLCPFSAVQAEHDWPSWRGADSTGSTEEGEYPTDIRPESATWAAPLPGNTRCAILPNAAEQGLSPLEERAVFSAKESLFKALFPLVGTYFGFEAAVVRVDLEAGRFEIGLTAPLGTFGAGTGWAGQVVFMKRGLVTVLLCL